MIYTATIHCVVPFLAVLCVWFSALLPSGDAFQITGTRWQIPLRTVSSATTTASSAWQIPTKESPMRLGINSILHRARQRPHRSLHAADGAGDLSYRHDLRNVAIIAHVDHGKTTLVDSMMKQSGMFRENQAVRSMDSEAQEKERGITIIAKNAAIIYNNTKINIIDTPGHADFGGEVERIMNMADGVLLVVDSVDGPKPQTRFVLKKAIEMGLKAIVVVNKMDRKQARPEYVVDKTFDLFNELNATDSQMDFQVVYASGMQGSAGLTPDSIEPNLNVIFEQILQLPKARVDSSKPLQLLIANIDQDEFIGKLGVGRIMNGEINQNSEIAYGKPGGELKRCKVNEIFVFNNVGREKVASASAGDIVVVSGIPDIAIGDTIMTKDNPTPLPAISVAAPTVRMFMSVNKSPLAGRDGKLVQSRAIRDRLMRELEKNVAMKVLETDAADTFELCGRGQLHLTVLIENMRREGFEMMIGPPTVIEREIDGQKCEPFDLVDIAVETQYAGAVVELLKKRKGELQSMTQSDSSDSQTRLLFVVPTRGMIGVRSALLTATKGNIVLDAVFDSYRPSVGPIMPRDRGSLLACEDGVTNSYGINAAQERGRMFIGSKEEVYKDMIVGIHSRPGDLAVNVCREKKLTNMRSAGAEGLAQLAPPMELSLDIAVEYIAEDELVEVTPHHIRMCKNPDHKRRR